MPVTPKTLIPTRYADTSGGTEYTVPASISTFVDNVTFSNVSSSEVTVDAWIIPSGEVKGVENQVIKGRPLAAGQVFSPVDMRHVLSSGYAIAMQASAADSVTIVASGREVD